MRNYVYVVLMQRPEAERGQKTFDGIEVYGVFDSFDHANFAIRFEARIHPTWNFMVVGHEIEKISHVLA